jgi:hypothetical protein
MLEKFDGNYYWNENNDLFEILNYRLSDSIGKDAFRANNIDYPFIWAQFDMHFKRICAEMQNFPNENLKESIKTYLMENGFMLEVLLIMKKQLIKPDHILRNYYKMVNNYKSLLKLLN